MTEQIGSPNIRLSESDDCYTVVQSSSINSCRYQKWDTPCPRHAQGRPQGSESWTHSSLNEVHQNQ